ncbi:hypothetical protein BN844_2059 [Pseudomonas sp. SHC52]|nr:hypothetical protein BN844_2059 [Pseudomonas sp. SHC52]
MPISADHRGQVQPRSDLIGHFAKGDLIEGRIQAAVDHAAGLVIDRRVATHPQLGASGHGGLRLQVAIEVEVRCLGLAFALVDLADDLAFQHRVAGRHHQLAGIAPHGITRFEALARSDQRVVVVIGLAPALAVIFIAFVEAGIEDVPRRLGHLVQPTIGALEPGLAQVATLHIQGAAGQVQLRRLLGHHIVAGERQRTALGRPFSETVPTGAQVPADLQQATRRVPAIGGVTVGARRDVDQVAHVDPDIVVGEFSALAVDRRIALLVTLHVDLDGIGFHRHLHANGAGHIDHRAIAHQAATGRADRDLAAGGQGDGAVLEIDTAATDDFDPRLIGAVDHAAEVVELTGDQVVRCAVQAGRPGVALAVQCTAAGGIEQHRRGAALPQGHAAAAVARGVEQVHSAAGVHRTAGDGDAVLLHPVPGQRDVASARLDQAAVDHRAGAAARLERRRDLVATGSGAQVATGALAAPDVEAVTRRQGGLALGGDDGAGVLHFRAQQQGITTAGGGGSGAMGFNPCAALHFNLAGRIGEGRLAAGGIDVQPALAELLIADVGRHRCQVAHIDLAGAAENDAVAVDQHHRAVALDLALDLARSRQGIIDPVEHGPVRLLLEIHRGIAPDVEGLPVENRLVGGLLDLHRSLAAGLGLLRSLGVEPALGQAVIDLEPTLAQPIRHDLHLPKRRLPPRSLGGLLGCDGGDGVVQVGQRTLQLRIGPLLLRQGRRHAWLRGRRSRRATGLG